ncbi:probable metal-nicotianamine transporter YSL7 [Gastrolobium bilobum]|uniref:probable metal-nicotianamine transporter YSL7 n=1 Tax=Gastrolobium bilobum TaxID=150636 RepID=UPI002AB283F5|nr:probable metal-nicotianamine transporter YSL7 [Gastrolobium bilobum]
MEENDLEGEVSTLKNTWVPTWTKQITIRSLVTSFILGTLFNFIICRLSYTSGLTPNLNVPVGLLGFTVIKYYTALLNKCGLLKQPFTRQENTLIQTCIFASSGIAFSSGTGSYLFGMSPYITAKDHVEDTPINRKRLSLGWMFGFIFAISFVGLFFILPLRKVMILKYKLPYRSRTATAHLINSVHTPTGSKLAKKQVALLFKSFCGSFAFACFQWFFKATNDCGFSSFPTFGLQAYNKRFYFDFSSTYVGIGMISTFNANASLLIGAIISWGILWPWIDRKKGTWYSEDLPPNSLDGMQGYKVYIAIAMILGDGFYQCIYMLLRITYSLSTQYLKDKNSSSVNPEIVHQNSNVDYDDQCRKEYFLKDDIPIWVAITGYVILAVVSIIVVSHYIFPQLKWYHILVCYLIAPILAFFNAYGCGLTGLSLATIYGEVAIIIFSSWVGIANGGIIAGLASCGVMMSFVSTASVLMQDFKTGYLTLTSPRSMLFSEVFGTIIGCVMSPLVFWLFYKAFPIGDNKSTYPSPNGDVYRGISLLGAKGFSYLPKNCLKLAIIFFCIAVLIDVIHDMLKHYENKYKIYRYIPQPMFLAIPFYLGGYFTIDRCIGSLIVYLWEKKNKNKAQHYVPAMAFGLLCGDSLWSVPAAILSLAGTKAPICMKFLSGTVNHNS